MGEERVVKRKKKARRCVIVFEIDMEVYAGASVPGAISKLAQLIEESDIGYSDAAVHEIKEIYRVTLVGKRDIIEKEKI